MIEIPVGTIERPITVVDFVAGLNRCVSVFEMTEYARQCPPAIVEEDRFAKAFKTRLEDLRAAGRNKAAA